MTITQTISNSLLHDLTVSQHLYTKINASGANWRPQENMRSTLELMQYLGMIGATTVEFFVTNPEGGMPREAMEKSYNATTFENFSEKLEEQKASIAKSLSTVTDADLLTKRAKLPNRPDVPLIDALLSAVKFLATYRHQLFLYAKQQGANIGTSNNWAGVDAPPRPVAEPATA